MDDSCLDEPQTSRRPALHGALRPEPRRTRFARRRAPERERRPDTRGCSVTKRVPTTRGSIGR